MKHDREGGIPRKTTVKGEKINGYSHQGAPLGLLCLPSSKAQEAAGTECSYLYTKKQVWVSGKGSTGTRTKPHPPNP